MSSNIFYFIFSKLNLNDLKYVGYIFFLLVFKFFIIFLFNLQHVFKIKFKFNFKNFYYNNKIMKL